MNFPELLRVASWVALCRAKLATRFPFRLNLIEDVYQRWGAWLGFLPSTRK